MKVKTEELSGAALDWAVAGLEGEDVWLGFHILRESRNLYVRDDGDSVSHYSPSTYWAQGGLIIEREGISVWQFDDVTWKAEKPLVGVDCVYEAPTLLIAAMRCYVASKLGDEVEVPDELLQGEQTE